MEHPDFGCLYGIDLNTWSGISDIEPCREWCAGNDQCGGVVVKYGNCYFKELQCKDDFLTSTGGAVCLKETA